jgi:hypothetical protein
LSTPCAAKYPENGSIPSRVIIVNRSAWAMPPTTDPAKAAIWVERDDPVWSSVP